MKCYICTGKPLSSERGSMTEEHLEYICKVLFDVRNRQVIADRCLLALNWQCVGRISEVAQLRWSAIKLYNSGKLRCMEILLVRAKTRNTQTLRVFMHRSSWAMCPFHALGTMIIVRPDPSEHLFQPIALSGEAVYVNRLLNHLFHSWGDDESLNKPAAFELYSSHAQRHGSAEACNEHPDIQTQWLVQRGAWSLDSIQTVFNYIAGTAKSDARVGRALAGWPSVDSGGMCPGMSSFYL